jgi:all-trans-retinol 13,14-reductase
MTKYDVIIIGSGFGGLQCACILSKQGFNVCVLEKNSQLGGCLQSFKRGDMELDTGFHYVGGLDEGQPLRRLFDYFGLMNLPWHRLDNDGFDEIIIDNRSFMYTNGYENFAEALSQKFPKEKDGLNKYAAFLKKVSDNVLNIFDGGQAADFSKYLFTSSAYDYLKSITKDPLLVDVLSGALLKMEPYPVALPLYTFAQINSSFVQSAYRLKGRSSMIADTLAAHIKVNGGVCLTDSEVTRLVENNRKITAVEVNKTDCLTADYVVSDIHPANLIALIDENACIRNVYRERINCLRNSQGMFTAHFVLKKNSIPYLNRNLFVYDKCNLWDNIEMQENKCAFVSFKVPEDGSPFTRNIDVLTPLFWKEVVLWENTQTGRRGKDYLSFKKQKAAGCLEFISNHIPNIKDSVEAVYTSTPLTYRDYTGAPHGSAYGICKDYNNPLETMLSPRTPVSNLFMTGQNQNLHGMLGVSVTSLLTCAQISGVGRKIAPALHLRQMPDA